MPTANIVIAEGSSISPDWVMLAPKPYPATGGVCTNSGRNANVAYMPTPRSRLTRLFVQTAVRRIIFMSISGVAARSSAVTQAAGQHDRRGQQADHPAGPPAPGRGLAQRHQQRDQPGGQQHRGQPADPARACAPATRGRTIMAAIAAATVRISGSQNSQW